MIKRSKLFSNSLECSVFVKKYTTEMKSFDQKTHLLKLFSESVSAVNPSKLIMENVKLEGRSLHICDKVFNVSDTNIYLVGFGKAVLGMASQCENILGDRLKRGVICIPENIQETHGSDLSLRKNSVIEVFEGAANNLPDEKAERGSDAIIKLVKLLTSKHDILITLISGGGSALFPKPVSGISLIEKLATITFLTSSGATITELNTVRKRLSKVKGGGLAGFSYPVQTICLILSDVINDPLDIIASGPLVPNFDAENAAYDVIKKYQLEKKIPDSVLKAVVEPCSLLTVPIVNDSFAHVTNFIIGNNTKALNSAKIYSEGCGFKTVILSNEVKGLVDEVADFYERLLCTVITSIQNKDSSCIVIDKENLGNNFDCESNFVNELSLLVSNWDDEMKMCVIAGGETTVKLTGDGKGGRNQELALIMSLKLHKLRATFSEFFDKYDVSFLSAGTDGIDGPTDAAGAFGEASVIEKALEMGLNVDKFLKRNDSYGFFNKINGGEYLIKTGHTGTNVMDIHVLLVYKRTVSDL